MNLLRYQHAERLIERARIESHNRNYSVAWDLLEEAHIFAQPNAGKHFYVHFEMLQLALKTKDKKEMWGQVVRLFLSIPSSTLCTYPKGNSGRSSMGLFVSMPISQRNEKKLLKFSKQEKEIAEQEKRFVNIKSKHPRLQLHNRHFRR